jgi:deazaflavin-dependent oxidoreductase (nitroreductase family)
MSMANTASTQRSERTAPGAARIINRFVLTFAGTRIFPLYGVLEHRGRRSGKVFHTPVVVKRTGDGFIVPMPWGEGTDWFRNLTAAGEAVIRWKGRDYPVVQPEVIDVSDAKPYFSAFQQAGMNRFHIAQCVKLRDRSQA